MRKWLLAAVCSLVAGNALAGEWYFLGVSEDNTIADLYDRSTVSTENGVLRAWRLSVLSSRAAKKDKTDYYLALDELNCKKKMYRRVTYTAYLNGRDVYTSESEGKWKYAIPGTMGEGDLVAICAKDKETYTGDNPHEIAERVRKVLDEQIAKSTPQKKPASF